jgi:hypothetical protein
MPITLNVPDWGQVQALTLREAAKRLDASMEDVQYWVDCDLFESYEWNITDARGKLKKQIIYIDLVDLAEAEKLARRFPEDAPWERILWFRYEQRQVRLHQQIDPRSTDRTLVQPQPPQQPQRPQRRGPLPRELSDDELLDELEAQPPARPVQASRLAPLRQTTPPAGRQPQRRQTIEDDYYEPDAQTVEDTHYPKKQKQKRGLLW